MSLVALDTAVSGSTGDTRVVRKKLIIQSRIINFKIIVSLTRVRTPNIMES